MKQKTLFLRMSVVLMMMSLSACTYSKIMPEAVPTDPSINPSTSPTAGTTTGRTTGSTAGTTSGTTTTAGGTTTSGTTSGTTTSGTTNTSGTTTTAGTTGSSTAGTTTSGTTTSGSTTTAGTTGSSTAGTTTAGTTTSGGSTGGSTSCGNGIREVGEQCDDGNQEPGDGCKASCYLQADNNFRCTGEIGARTICVPSSGGGVIETTGGTTTAGTTGSGGGTGTTAICGNGIREVGEQCDDGNRETGDGCKDSCNLQRDDNFICTGEIGARTICVPSSGGSGTSSTSTGGSTGTATGGSDLCGNSFINPGEACDDRNRSDGDGCSSLCTIEPGYRCEIGPGGVNYSICRSTTAGTGSGSSGSTGLCGNGVVNGGEICDDGNTIDGDGCENNCTSRAYKIAYASSDAAGRNHSLKTSIVRILPGNAALKPNTSKTLMTNTLPISSPAVSANGSFIAYNQSIILANSLGLVSLSENGDVASQRNIPSLSIAGATHILGAFPAWKGNSLAFTVSPSSRAPSGHWAVYSGTTVNPTTLEVTGGNIVVPTEGAATNFKNISFARNTMAFERGIGEPTIQVVDSRCDDPALNPMNVCNVRLEGSYFETVYGSHPSLAYISNKLMMTFDHVVGDRKQIALCELNFIPATDKNPADFSCDHVRELTTVGENHSPQFTKDGKYVFFTQEVGGNKDIYVIGLDSSIMMLAIPGDTQDFDAAVFPIASLSPLSIDLANPGYSPVLQGPLPDTGKGGVEEQPINPEDLKGGGGSATSIKEIPIFTDINKGTSSSGK